MLGSLCISRRLDGRNKKTKLDLGLEPVDPYMTVSHPVRCPRVTKSPTFAGTLQATPELHAWNARHPPPLGERNRGARRERGKGEGTGESLEAPEETEETPARIEKPWNINAQIQLNASQVVQMFGRDSCSMRRTHRMVYVTCPISLKELPSNSNRTYQENLFTV